MSATPSIFDSIGNFFKDAENADKNSWNPVVFFGILLIATMPFVNQPKLIFIGYIFLAVLYIVIFGYVIYGAFKTGVYEKIKGFLSNNNQNSLFDIGLPMVGNVGVFSNTSFGFFKFAFILFFIIINTMSWMASPKKGVGGNIAGAVLTPLAPILVYLAANRITGDAFEKSDIFKSILFFIAIAAFIGLIVYNFVSLTQVLASLSNRTKQMKSYDLGVSKARMNEINGYSISLYLAILSAMYIIHDSTTPLSSVPPKPDNIYPKESSYIPVSISYLLFTGATIANFFNSRKIVNGLKYDSKKIMKKTPAQNAKATAEEKVKTQNVFITAYFGILNFFNPANL